MGKINNVKELQEELWVTIKRLDGYLSDIEKSKWGWRNLIDVGKQVNSYMDFLFYRGKLFAYCFVLGELIRLEGKKGSFMKTNKMKAMDKMLRKHKMYFTRSRLYIHGTNDWKSPDA